MERGYKIPNLRMLGNMDLHKFWLYLSGSMILIICIIWVYFMFNTDSPIAINLKFMELLILPIGIFIGIIYSRKNKNENM